MVSTATLNDFSQIVCKLSRHVKQETWRCRLMLSMEEGRVQKLESRKFLSGPSRVFSEKKSCGQGRLWRRCCIPGFFHVPLNFRFPPFPTPCSSYCLICLEWSYIHCSTARSRKLPQLHCNYIDLNIICEMNKVGLRYMMPVIFKLLFYLRLHVTVIYCDL